MWLYKIDSNSCWFIVRSAIQACVKIWLVYLIWRHVFKWFTGHRYFNKSVLHTRGGGRGVTTRKKLMATLRFQSFAESENPRIFLFIYSHWGPTLPFWMMVWTNLNLHFLRMLLLKFSYLGQLVFEKKLKEFSVYISI